MKNFKGITALIVLFAMSNQYASQKGTLTRTQQTVLDLALAKEKTTVKKIAALQGKPIPEALTNDYKDAKKTLSTFTDSTAKEKITAAEKSMAKEIKGFATAIQSVELAAKKLPQPPAGNMPQPQPKPTGNMPQPTQGKIQTGTMPQMPVAMPQPIWQTQATATNLGSEEYLPKYYNEQTKMLTIEGITKIVTDIKSNDPFLDKDQIINAARAKTMDLLKIARKTDKINLQDTTKLHEMVSSAVNSQLKQAGPRPGLAWTQASGMGTASPKPQPATPAVKFGPTQLYDSKTNTLNEDLVNTMIDSFRRANLGPNREDMKTSENTAGALFMDMDQQGFTKGLNNSKRNALFAQLKDIVAKHYQSTTYSLKPSQPTQHIQLAAPKQKLLITETTSEEVNLPLPIKKQSALFSAEEVQQTRTEINQLTSKYMNFNPDQLWTTVITEIKNPPVNKTTLIFDSPYLQNIVKKLSGVSAEDLFLTMYDNEMFSQAYLQEEEKKTLMINTLLQLKQLTKKSPTTTQPLTQQTITPNQDPLLSYFKASGKINPVRIYNANTFIKNNLEHILKAKNNSKDETIKFYQQNLLPHLNIPGMSTQALTTQLSKEIDQLVSQPKGQGGAMVTGPQKIVVPQKKPQTTEEEEQLLKDFFYGMGTTLDRPAIYSPVTGQFNNYSLQGVLPVMKNDITKTVNFYKDYLFPTVTAFDKSLTPNVLEAKLNLQIADLFGKTQPKLAVTMTSSSQPAQNELKQNVEIAAIPYKKNLTLSHPETGNLAYKYLQEIVTANPNATALQIAQALIDVGIYKDIKDGKKKLEVQNKAMQDLLAIKTVPKKK